MGKRQPGSWASLASDDSDNDEEVLALVTPLATKRSSIAAQPIQPSVGREAKASRG
jgi:hypothetical protein